MLVLTEGLRVKTDLYTYVLYKIVTRALPSRLLLRGEEVVHINLVENVADREV